MGPREWERVEKVARVRPSPKRIRADTSASRWTLQPPRVLRGLLVCRKETAIQYLINSRKVNKGKKGCNVKAIKAVILSNYVFPLNLKILNANWKKHADISKSWIKLNSNFLIKIEIIDSKYELIIAFVKYVLIIVELNSCSILVINSDVSVPVCYRVLIFSKCIRNVSEKISKDLMRV